jgi:hypothetical protein
MDILWISFYKSNTILKNIFLGERFCKSGINVRRALRRACLPNNMPPG